VTGMSSADTGPGRSKPVADLVHGDLTVDYGLVTHREGRKVWFEHRVVTFSSTEEEVALEHSVTAE
jgi:hypothetical protein